MKRVGGLETESWGKTSLDNPARSVHKLQLDLQVHNGPDITIQFTTNEMRTRRHDVMRYAYDCAMTVLMCQ